MSDLPPFMFGLFVGVFPTVMVFGVAGWRPWTAERDRLKAELATAKESLEKANHRANGWAGACIRARKSLLSVETEIASIRSAMESDQMPAPASRDGETD